MAATTITRTDLVLEAARSNARAVTDLEIERLLLAVEWAELHPGDEVDESVPWHDRDLEVAGPGASGPSPGPAPWATATPSSPTDIPADQHPADSGSAHRWSSLSRPPSADDGAWVRGSRRRSLALAARPTVSVLLR